MSGRRRASHGHPRDSSGCFLPAGEAGAPPPMTVPPPPSAPPPHLIFGPAAHPIPLPGQSLASSSAVPSFALTVLAKLPVLPVSPAALQAYDHPPPARTISDQAYANMPRFSTNGPHAAAHFRNPIANERWVPGYPQNPGNQGNVNAMNSRWELT
ncbi:hypothetical protein BDDG_09926 [Blastomyces dermatitidis ATCC 18188]|uniref:Uncharacterized protein n=1 Tax=Ajellomyces dermatitidis (strain ATCC 18188 / CBS 674.68) TaxID=653446 RepID=F2TUR2_AJEDA|nr:hypothetical protein BDDG_09926 [Blastomyces dermatitidis ATCC 18188]